MSLSWQPQGDLKQVVDRTAALTYVAPNGSETALSRAYLVKSVEYFVDQGAARQRRWEVEWVIDQTELVQTPQLGATLKSGSQQWVIQRVEHLEAPRQWKLAAELSTPQPEYSVQLSLLRPQWGKDAYGGAQAAWDTVATDVPAVLRLIGRELVRRDGWQQLQNIYQTGFEDSAGLAPGWHVVDALGRRFSTLRVEALPWSQSRVQATLLLIP